MHVFSKLLINSATPAVVPIISTRESLQQFQVSVSKIVTSTRQREVERSSGITYKWTTAIVGSPVQLWKVAPCGSFKTAKGSERRRKNSTFNSCQHGGLGGRRSGRQRCDDDEQGDQSTHTRSFRTTLCVHYRALQCANVFQSLNSHDGSNSGLFAFVAFCSASVECLLKGVYGKYTKCDVYARLQSCLLQTRGCFT